MATLLKQSQIVDNDQWVVLEDGQTPEGATIVSLSYWQENQQALAELSQAGQLGLHLNSDETADLVAEACDQFALICVDFPKFADGRGYSTARLLRERYGYTGELRSVGDVLIDQLFFMKRVGFDSYALRADQDVDDALTAFATFSNPYQGDVNDPRPLFRRVNG